MSTDSSVLAQRLTRTGRIIRHVAKRGFELLSAVGIVGAGSALAVWAVATVREPDTELLKMAIERTMSVGPPLSPAP